MISRRSAAYPSMIQRASSSRDDRGGGSSCLLGISMGRFMPNDRQRTKRFIELNQKTPFEFAWTYSHGRDPRPRIVGMNQQIGWHCQHAVNVAFASMTPLARLRR